MSVPERPINKVGSGGQGAAIVAGGLGAVQLPQAHLALSVALFPLLYTGPLSLALSQAPTQISASACLDNLSRESSHLTFFF